MADNIVQIVIRARDEASQTFKGLDASLRQMAFGIGAVTSVASVATAALAALVHQSAQAADHFMDLSRVTGIAADELSRMDFAASQSGTNLDTLVRGLNIMARSAREASTGVGEAAETFADLGIKVRDVGGGLRPVQALFGELADRIAATTSQTERVALAMRVLGRGGAELVPILSLGSGGMQELMRQSDALGATISEQAAILSDEYNDALDATQKQVRGLGAALGEVLIPSVTEFIESTQPAIKAAIDWTRENQALVAGFAAGAAAIAVLGTAVLGISGLLLTAQAAALACGVGITSILGPAGLAAAAILALGAAIGIFVANKDALDDLPRSAGELKNAIMGLKGEMVPPGPGNLFEWSQEHLARLAEGAAKAKQQATELRDVYQGLVRDAAPFPYDPGVDPAFRLRGGSKVPSLEGLTQLQAHGQDVPLGISEAAHESAEDFDKFALGLAARLAGLFDSVFDQILAGGAQVADLMNSLLASLLKLGFQLGMSALLPGLGSLFGFGFSGGGGGRGIPLGFGRGDVIPAGGFVPAGLSSGFARLGLARAGSSSGGQTVIINAAALDAADALRSAYRHGAFALERNLAADLGRS